MQSEMTPSDFFALVKLKSFIRPERDRSAGILSASSVGLVYDFLAEVWSGSARFDGIAFGAAGRSVAECFEILMHGLRRRGLIADEASGEEPVSSAT